MNEDLPRLCLSPLAIAPNVGKSLAIGGQWCLTPETVELLGEPEASKLLLPARSVNKDSYSREADLCWHLYQKFSKALAAILNNIHGERNSLRYWKTLLHSYLYQTVATVVDHYYVLEHLVALAPQAVVPVLDVDVFASQHIARGGSSRQFHFAVYSLLAQYFPSWQLEQLSHTEYQKNLMRIGDGKKSLPQDAANKPGLSSAVSLIFESIKKAARPLRDLWFGRVELSHFKFFRSAVLLLGDQYLTASSRNQLLRQLQVPKVYCFASPPKMTSWQEVSPISRAKIQFMDLDTVLEQALAKVIKYTLPTVYLENYRSLRQQTKKAVPHRPLVIVNSMNCPGGISQDFFIAEAVERQRSKHLMVCHGGCYGVMAMSVQEQVWAEIADTYALWSDPKQYGEPCRTIKLPALRFLKWRDLSYRPPAARDDKILVLTTGHYPSRYTYNSIYPYTIDSSYYDWQVAFMEALGHHLRDEILVRDYHSASRIADNVFTRYVREQNILCDTKQSFANAILSSKLAVHTLPQTTYLESLILDHPTLCFWNPEANLLRDDLLPYYEAMVEAGVFHYSPESAAAKIRVIAENPRQWWQSSAVTSAVNEFRRHVCYSVASDQALPAWRDCINEHRQSA